MCLCCFKCRQNNLQLAKQDLKWGAALTKGTLMPEAKCQMVCPSFPLTKAESHINTWQLGGNLEHIRRQQASLEVGERLCGTDTALLSRVLSPIEGDGWRVQEE